MPHGSKLLSAFVHGAGQDSAHTVTAVVLSTDPYDKHARSG